MHTESACCVFVCVFGVYVCVVCVCVWVCASECAPLRLHIHVLYVYVSCACVFGHIHTHIDKYMCAFLGCKRAFPLTSAPQHSFVFKAMRRLVIGLMKTGPKIT